jgi:hypothetical protein
MLQRVERSSEHGSRQAEADRQLTSRGQAIAWREIIRFDELNKGGCRLRAPDRFGFREHQHSKPVYHFG